MQGVRRQRLTALTAVPLGHVATIVTSLEMHARPLPQPLPPSELRLVRWSQPQPARYRALFRRIGEPWLWFTRLTMPDAQLAAILDDSGTEIFAVEDRDGIEIGLLELNFRTRPECELAFFGLVPELARRGHGRWLMTHALNLAWRPGVDLVWVHTCTLDHPSALGFYRAQGFEAVERGIEVFPDPRLRGYLSENAAPHVPIIR